MENQKSNTCILVQEILPIYMDECISDECKAVIETHISHCKACETRLEKMKENAIAVKEESIAEIQEKQDFSSLAKKIKHSRIRSMIITVCVASILFMTYITCFTMSTTASNSMYPTIKAQENCLIFRYAYAITSPKRGDIICMKVDTEFANGFQISRVVGMPGDHIEISAGKLWINGEEQISYQGITSPGNDCSVTVEEDSYFLISDNFDHAYDSRYMGSVDRSNIYGKCIFYGNFLKNPFVETSVATNAAEVEFSELIVAESKHNPEEIVLHNEDLQKLRLHVKQLKKKYREVVIYRIYFEMSFAEISKIMKISENSAKVLFYRAKEILRNQMK